MANTIVQRTLRGTGSDARVFRLIRIVSDGSNETATVIFQNSSFKNDVTKGSFMNLKFSGKSAGMLRLEWGQSANSPICSFNPQNAAELDFTCFGGITNPAAAGATGNVLLTTTGLTTGDEITFVFEIFQN